MVCQEGLEDVPTSTRANTNHRDPPPVCDPLGYVTSGAGYALIFNNTGSVTNVISNAGATVATYTYDPYGHANTATGPDAAQNLINYEGLLDSDSNYLSLGDRWYNPVTDNFTTQDPETVLNDPADANHYAYADDDPANNIDPTGMGVCDSFLGCLKYIGLTTVAIAGTSSTVGFGIGCVASIEAGCIEGGGIGAAVGWWSGFQFGLSYSLEKALISND